MSILSFDMFAGIVNAIETSTWLYKIFFWKHIHMIRKQTRQYTSRNVIEQDLLKSIWDREE